MEHHCSQKVIITSVVDKEDNMNKGLVAALAFIFGAGTGSLITYKVVKDKYAKLAEDDIAEMREYYSHKISQGEELASEDTNIEEVANKAEEARNNGDIFDYAKKISEEKYLNDVNVADENPKAYTYIDYADFGEIEDYDVISLTYYSDGVLADDNDEEVEDFIEKVGNFTTHFDGEDIIYVRNDDFEAYYEIIKDHRKFSDVVGFDED